MGQPTTITKSQGVRMQGMKELRYKETTEQIPVYIERTDKNWNAWHYAIILKKDGKEIRIPINSWSPTDWFDAFRIYDELEKGSEPSQITGITGSCSSIHPPEPPTFKEGEPKK